MLATAIIMLIVTAIMLVVTFFMYKIAKDTQNFIKKENEKEELKSFYYDITSLFWNIFLGCASLNEKEMAHNIAYRKFMSDINYYSIVFYKNKNLYKHIMFLFEYFHIFDWPKTSVNKKNKLKNTIRALDNIIARRLIELCHPKHPQTIIITHNKTKIQ